MHTAPQHVVLDVDYTPRVPAALMSLAFKEGTPEAYARLLVEEYVLRTIECDTPLSTAGREGLIDKVASDPASHKPPKRLTMWMGYYSKAVEHRRGEKAKVDKFVASPEGKTFVNVLEVRSTGLPHAYGAIICVPFHGTTRDEWSRNKLGLRNAPLTSSPASSHSPASAVRHCRTRVFDTIQDACPIHPV